MRVAARVIFRVTKVSVVDGDPVGVEFRHAVGAAGIERGGLPLRGLDHLAVHLRGRSLIEANLIADGVLEVANRLEQPQDPDGGHIGRVGRLVEADADVALGGEVVDLRRADLPNQPGQAVAIGHVSMMEHQGSLHLMNVAVQVFDPLGAEGARPADEPVDFVALVEQEFGEVRAILACDAGDESPLRAWGHALVPAAGGVVNGPLPRRWPRVSPARG
jgi:hypothetical protein